MLIDSKMIVPLNPTSFDPRTGSLGKRKSTDPHEASEDLIKQYRDGKVDADSQIVDIYIKRIYNFALRLSGNEETADKISENTFSEAFKKIKSYNYQEGPFSNYLFKIAYQLWQKKFSDNLSKKPQGLDTMLASNHELSQAEMVNKTISTLPGLEQSLMFLRHSEKKSYPDISEIVNLSEAQVRSFLNRTRIIIFNKVKPYLGSHD